MRIAFGVVMVIEVVRFFAHGWIPKYYIAPVFHFTYQGFDWVRPWPGNGMYLHFAALGVCALGIMLGFAYRISSVLLCVGFTYVFLLEKARYLNHFYLICLLAFLLAVLPANRAFSLDARSRGECRGIPAWSVGLLRAQLGLVFLFAGTAKLNGDWLRGEPLRSWLAEHADHPVLGVVLGTDWGAHAFSYGGLALDLFAWPLLSWKRTRLAMFLITCVFHVLNAVLFDIGVFPWLMIAVTTIFFEPDWPRRLLRIPAPNFESLVVAVARRRVVAALVGTYLVVQTLVPLRHLLYPGSVHWTEEGHMFSWHMKLRDKNASALFFLTDPATGKTRVVDPRSELTPEQVRKMAGRPDMILEYAHHLARTRAAPGETLEVRARVTASLNGRAPQLLIDPDVDLVTQDRGLAHDEWILPLTTPLPSAERDAIRR